MRRSYSEKDLLELDEIAKTIWDIDYSAKRIKRKPNASSKTVPVKSLYRMVKKDRRENESSRCFDFPFTNSNFAGVLGLAENWHISVEDRQYLERDMVLFADDQKTILILPEDRKWWDSTWFTLFSISIGIAGLLVGFF